MSQAWFTWQVAGKNTVFAWTSKADLAWTGSESNTAVMVLNVTWMYFHWLSTRMSTGIVGSHKMESDSSLNDLFVAFTILFTHLVEFPSLITRHNHQLLLGLSMLWFNLFQCDWISTLLTLWLSVKTKLYCDFDVCNVLDRRVVNKSRSFKFLFTSNKQFKKIVKHWWIWTTKIIKLCARIQ